MKTNSKMVILIEKGLLVLFMLSYFIPNFYAYDRIGNQWLYISIICIISFLHLIIYDNIYKRLKSVITQKETLFYLIFIFWALTSISYSINRIEALVTFNQYFTVFLSFIFLKIFSNKIPNCKQFLLNIFMVLLFLEVVLSIYPIYHDIEKGGISFRSIKYAGAAANVNIAAFSLLYKTPIIFYFINNGNVGKKIILYVMLYLVLLIISIHGTRGAFLGVGLCYFSYIIYLFFLNKKLSFKLKQFAAALLILFLSISSNIGLSDNNSNVISRASSINIGTIDGSINQRLRYYGQGLSHFFHNPIFGVGIGNWKLKSIEYDKNDINGFIVPYHAHNDFIQILTELGLFGLCFYTLFIFFATKNLFKLKLYDDKINYLFLGILSIYLLDSMLNFPIARPISQIFLVSILCFISLYDKKNNA